MTGQTVSCLNLLVVLEPIHNKLENVDLFFSPFPPPKKEINCSQSFLEPTGFPGAPKISHSGTQTLRKQPYKECARGEKEV